MSRGDHPLVLAVDPSTEGRSALTDLLVGEGYDVVTSPTAKDGFAEFEERLPDVVILELDLPDHSGLDLCREIRGRSLVPIVVLSSRRDEVDAVCALDVGADDYVNRPFRSQEFAARLRAALRRAPLTGTGGLCDGHAAVCADDLCLDPERYQATFRERPLELGRREFELLELLVANAGQVVTREMLLDRVWGPSYMGTGRTLDMHITRLRRKLSHEDAAERIVTVRGLGYRYERHDGRGSSFS